MVSRTVVIRIYEKFHHRCAICDKETAFDEGEVDHIKPKTKGGTDEPSNLQWLCHRCNKLKGNKRTNEEVRELLDDLEASKIVKNFIPKINYELIDLKEEFIVRAAFEKTCDNFLREPQEMLITHIRLLKRMGIEPNLETVVSLIAGTIMGATIVSVSGPLEKEPNEREIERIAEKIQEVIKLLKRRIPEMRTIFQNAMQQ